MVKTTKKKKMRLPRRYATQYGKRIIIGRAKRLGGSKEGKERTLIHRGTGL
jgi:hypothetical protein